MQKLDPTARFTSDEIRFHLLSLAAIISLQFITTLGSLRVLNLLQPGGNALVIESGLIGSPNLTNPIKSRD